MRKLAAVAVCSIGLMVLGTGPALAGEVTGNGKVKDVNGRSICAYSGLNDDPDQPGEEGRTQSYGQLVKKGHADPQQFNPGDACNPNAEPPAEP